MLDLHQDVIDTPQEQNLPPSLHVSRYTVVQVAQLQKTWKTKHILKMSYTQLAWKGVLFLCTIAPKHLNWEPQPVLDKQSA